MISSYHSNRRFTSLAYFAKIYHRANDDKSEIWWTSRTSGYFLHCSHIIHILPLIHISLVARPAHTANQSEQRLEIGICPQGEMNLNNSKTPAIWFGIQHIIHAVRTVSVILIILNQSISCPVISNAKDWCLMTYSGSGLWLPQSRSFGFESLCGPFCYGHEG